MRQEVKDIPWRSDFEGALSEARKFGRAVVVKPAGQGYDPGPDNW
jgi:hypothetical protein